MSLLSDLAKNIFDVKDIPINRPVDISKLKLSPEQLQVFEHMEKSNTHMFITGKAGTGKSVLLQYFKENSQKPLVVAAPTGIAALNVGGQTIHSLFGFPPKLINKKEIRITKKTAAVLQNIETLVIDEISMVRADIMDGIDYVLRKVRQSQLPFGGVQLIMFGDLYQLPPVLTDKELHNYFSDNYGGYYFFHAPVWLKTNSERIELTKNFRQKDTQFQEILNAVRTREISEDLLTQLNTRVVHDIPTKNIISLVPTNQQVSNINSSKLKALNGPLKEYHATITGDMDESYFPTDKILQLKKGAQVLFIKNDKEKRWVNGSIGIIKKLTDNEIIVRVDGHDHSVPIEIWPRIENFYNPDTKKIEEKIVGTFSQFPLKLAWALTIHKSQGQTHTEVIIDLGRGAFAHGQTYVALSRCKSLEGIYLKREVWMTDIIVDPVVIGFMKRHDSTQS